MKLTGWGLFPKVNTELVSPSTVEDLIKILKRGSRIARGNGRSYGDSSISKANTIDMKNFNHFLNFDEGSGLLITEAGVLLSDVIKIFLPKGWFPYVTPGSKYVTIGGMAASDVHGKNHYKNGSFSNYVEWLDILTNEGNIIRCSRKENSELFSYTLGGMGLTGIIIKIAFFLKPVETAWINQNTIVTKSIEHTLRIFEENLDAPYSVAWIDCQSKGKYLGRSILTFGEHSKLKQLSSNATLAPFKIEKKYKISIPFFLPSFLLNNLSIKLFNQIYYFKGLISKKSEFVSYEKFFYPLDKILNWNRIYGKRGFLQFQCVIPLDNSKEGILELINTISNYNSSSFLAVLKRFGKQSSFFSFPTEGYSLAMDFPMNNKNLALMNILDEITIRNGGRFYLAKDSRIKSDIFYKSDETRIDKYKNFRKNNNCHSFSSSQSERLGL